MDPREQAIAAQVEQAVVKRIEDDDLTLPSLPAVVGKALDLLRRQDFSFAKVAAAIEPDPIVAARVLRMVNSAAMATREPASNIAAAVARLGGAGLHSFLIEISARSVFDSKDRQISQASRGLWEHSLAVGLLSRDLAITVGGEDPESAYLAGLLHDIGKPVVAAMLLDAEKRLRGTRTQGWLSVETWIEVIARCHRGIGVTLSTRWQLPQQAQRALRDWGAYDEAQPRSMSNIVRFANAVAKQKGLYVGKVNSEENDALVAAGAALVGMPLDAVKILSEALPELVRERMTV